MLATCTEVAVGEAYVRGAFDIEGDMVAAFELADLLGTQTRGWTKNLSIAAMLRRLPDFKYRSGHGETRKARLKGKKNSPHRDRNAIRFHYDVSNAFYAFWLDPRMVYSCAYFENEGTDLERAQLRKLDLICRKLDLQPGERSARPRLRLGRPSPACGNLLRCVRRDGITLSQKQLEWCSG